MNSFEVPKSVQAQHAGNVAVIFGILRTPTEGVNDDRQMAVMKNHENRRGITVLKNRRAATKATSAAGRTVRKNLEQPESSPRNAQVDCPTARKLIPTTNRQQIAVGNRRGWPDCQAMRRHFRRYP